MSEHEDGKNIEIAKEVIKKRGVYQMGFSDPVTFAKEFSSFSGVDVRPKVNGEPLDSLQAIAFEMIIGKPGIEDKIEGTMIFLMLFDSVLNSLPKDPFTLTLRACTEFGQCVESILEGVRITRYQQGMSVDDSVIEEHLRFEAESFKPFTVIERVS